MNRYMMIRRLRGPAYLLLVGALALLNQADILSWGKSWPLFLILAGVLLLAERAALATEDGYPQGPYPGQPYAGPYPASNPNAASGSNLESAPQAPPVEGSASAQAYAQDSGKEPGGGQS
jgi:hypothetical protein